MHYILSNLSFLCWVLTLIAALIVGIAHLLWALIVAFPSLPFATSARNSTLVLRDCFWDIARVAAMLSFGGAILALLTGGGMHAH